MPELVRTRAMRGALLRDSLVVRQSFVMAATACMLIAASLHVGPVPAARDVLGAAPEFASALRWAAATQREPGNTQSLHDVVPGVLISSLVLAGLPATNLLDDLS